MGRLRKAWPTMYCVAGNVGNGHRMRCRAIAEAWPGSDMLLPPSAVSGPGVVLVDDYDVTNAEVLEWQNRGHLVVVYQDFTVDVAGNIIISPTSQRSGEYQCGNDVLLLGHEYYPIRGDFRIECDVVFDKVGVIPGSGKWDYAGITREVKYASVLEGLTEQEFARQLGQCEAVITPASVSALEAVSMGKLAFLVITADDQRTIYDCLIDNGVAFPYHGVDNLKRKMAEPGLKTAMFAKCRQFVDGGGSERIVKVIKKAWQKRG